MRTVLNRKTWVVLGWLLSFTTFTAFAQEGDLIGFKGGYKALSRLCEQNLDQASRLLANDYSRGYFVSLSIPAGTDTVTDIVFLTATPPDMAAQIAWALKGTNGQWVRKDKIRRFLVPIFFCQNHPPNDSLFSQLLITNNVGFSVDHFPDQWPEAAEGVWLHPICPLVTGARSGTPQRSGAGTPAGTAAVIAAPVVIAASPNVGNAASGTGGSSPSAGGASTNGNATTGTAMPGAAATVGVAGAAATTAAAAPASGQPTGWPAPVAKTVSAGALTSDSLSASGVYQTKEQFNNRTVIFGTPNPAEQKGLLSWFTVDYTAFGTVRLKSENKEYQEFPVGTIYGFRSSRVQFVYIKSMKEYFAVVRASPLFYLIMDERKENGYNGNSTIDGIFMYAHSLDGPFKEFTRRAIDAEFASNPAMAADMQILRKELNRHCVQMSPGDFASCVELAKDYMAKWETATPK